jgi:biopolymer transport protein TolQ
LAIALPYNQVKLSLHTMPFTYSLALYAGGEVLDMISQSGPVAKSVLFILLAFSVLSWAIIVSKWNLMRRARRQSGRFVRAFRKAQRFGDMQAVEEQFRPSPLVGVFHNGYEEARRQATAGGPPNIPALQRAMQIAASEEVTRFERSLPWLAITAAVTPFIGLFGTVWGIIDAFHGLGTAGAATPWWPTTCSPTASANSLPAAMISPWNSSIPSKAPNPRNA